MQNDISTFTGVSLCKKSGRIRIFHSTIIELGNPKYIRFLFNTDKKALVIQACENKEPENFLVPEYNPENWDFAVHSSPMLKMICKCAAGKRIRPTVRMECVTRNIVL